MKFTEEKLEQAVIELFEAEGYKHLNGEQIHKEMPDVLLREDLKQYLLNRYSNENITLNEIEAIIRKLELYPAESNKEIIKLIADGFLLKRDMSASLPERQRSQTGNGQAGDRSKKDLYIQLIDFGNLPASNEPRPDDIPTVVAEKQAEYTANRNIYKIVNQLEIQGYEKRIPDAIIYINGIPLVVIEFKKVNKIKGTDFTKKFKKLLEKYNERKEDIAFANDVLDDIAGQFADLFKDLQKEKSSFEEMGIDFEEKAFYDILKAVAEKHKFEYPHEKLIPLSQAVKKVVDDKAKYTDWSQRADIKAELKVDLILVLAEHGYPPVPKDEVFKEIFEQAENFKKYRDE